MRACCLAGQPETSSPKGNDTLIAEYPCYVVGEGSKVIVVAPDVFGLSPHTKTLCDNFSALGFRVYAIDYFEGNPLPDSVMDALSPYVLPPIPGEPALSVLGRLFKFLCFVLNFIYVLPKVLPFAWRNIRQSKIQAKFPVVEAVIKEITQISTNIGIVGYCFGGPIALHFATIEHSPIKVAAEAHGMVALADVESLKKPFLFCCASDDFAFPESRVKAAEAIIKKKFDENIHKIIRYPGTFHGFAVRGDSRNPKIMKAKADAMHDICDFFNTYLK